MVLSFYFYIYFDHNQFFILFSETLITYFQARIQGALGPAPTPGTEGPAPEARVPSSQGQKKGHWCPLNGCSTPFKHNMAINILKSCKSVFAYVKNRSSPSHIRSSIPWRPPLAEILDPRLISQTKLWVSREKTTRKHRREYE